MERLILEWEDTDGFTYSCPRVSKGIYSSKEELIIALEEFAEIYILHILEHGVFDIDEKYIFFPLIDDTLDITLFVENYKYIPPTIRTLDEWFPL
jgi:hypothetical protein